ncbi:hypothetical protein G6011_05019 [Alternaria panax]|uniref:Uncharacterized protein n=1 Tax=Alternaria panax TaxID=48097 RepID=A0AAD4FBY8_9PLEO|nr:hypothetical protein G6011_05019 [Alternaria panax]
MATFDNLPAEVRNTVYGQLLDRCHPQQTHTALALFGLSKQIGQESTSYFHQHNTFAITIASPANDSATILPPIADKWIRYLRRLAVYITTAGANSERERKIASTIASLATIGAKFENLYIRMDSSLSRLTNSRMDDSVLHAQHPITIALRQVLDANVAKVIRLELHGVWFAPGTGQALHAQYGTQLQFFAGRKPVADPCVLERFLTGSFVSSHLISLGVDDEAIANAYSPGDESSPSTPSSLPSSVCSAFQDLDMFSVTSFELNSETTAEDEEPRDDANESSFFAGIDIREWEASTQAAEEEELQGQADMGLDEDEDDEMEEVSQDDMDAFMGNMEDVAHHIANDVDMSYMTNFAPDLLLHQHNLSHLT